MRVQVLTLWQTAILRLSQAARARRDQRGAALLRRSRLFDAVAAGAPRRAERGRRPLARAGRHAAAARSCAWVRGSAATATATRSSPPMCVAHRPAGQRAAALRHHLDGIARPGDRAVDVVATGHADRRAGGARRRGPATLAVPRRRAVPPGAAWHARPAGGAPPSTLLGDAAGPHRSHAHDRAATRRSDELLADLDVVDAVVAQRTASAALADAARRAGARAASSCSASTCAASTCARTRDVHEAVVAELLAIAGDLRATTARSTRPTARRARAPSCARPAPAARAGRGRTRRRPRERAGDPRRRRRRRAAASAPLPSPHYVISKCDVGQRRARGGCVLLQGGRPARVDIVPLFETIDDLEAAGATLDALLGDADVPRLARAAAAACRR